MVNISVTGENTTTETIVLFTKFLLTAVVMKHLSRAAKIEMLATVHGVHM